jgi:HEPN domain-containing protein
MPPEESRYVGDWVQIARKDLDRAKRMLEDADSEASGFFLQQAMEKYLKGFLLSEGWTLKRIHDLEILLNEAIKHDP